MASFLESVIVTCEWVWDWIASVSWHDQDRGTGRNVSPVLHHPKNRGFPPNIDSRKWPRTRYSMASKLLSTCSQSQHNWFCRNFHGHSLLEVQQPSGYFTRLKDRYRTVPLESILTQNVKIAIRRKRKNLSLRIACCRTTRVLTLLLWPAKPSRNWNGTYLTRLQSGLSSIELWSMDHWKIFLEG